MSQVSQISAVFILEGQNDMTCSHNVNLRLGWLRQSKGTLPSISCAVRQRLRTCPIEAARHTVLAYIS